MGKEDSPLIRNDLLAPFSIVKKYMAFVIGASVFTAIALSGIRSMGILELLELTMYDRCIQARLITHAPNRDSRLFGIIVTEEDIANLGHWPMSDNLLATLLSRVLEHDPAVVGLDLYRNFAVPPGTERLEKVLDHASNVVGVMKFGDDKLPGVPAQEILLEKGQAGFNDFPVDHGGVVRRGLLFLDDGHQSFSSFPLLLALHYLSRHKIYPRPDPEDPTHIRLGDITISPFNGTDGGYATADDRGYQFLLDYGGGLEMLEHTTLTAALNNDIKPEQIAGKVILIGVEAQSLNDGFYTPYSRLLKGDHREPGIKIIGHAVNQLIRSALENHRPIKVLSDPGEWGLILAGSLAGAILAVFFRSPLTIAVSNSAGLILLGSGAFFCFQQGIWVPVVPVALAAVAASGITIAYIAHDQYLEKKRLHDIFSKHVSTRVADKLWEDRDQYLEHGRPRSQRVHATVLFSDLKGFTSVSEKLDPQVLLDWLNRYMETMAELVTEYHGFVDDYLGDAIKANFGIPISSTREKDIGQDAINAVHCALAMDNALGRINDDCREKKLPPVGMRIGIFTGPVVAGCLGSSQRLKYTSIGDTVNTAARLENLDKALDHPDFKNRSCRIFIGGATYQYVKDHFHIEFFDTIKLKGKDDKIDVYRVAGPIEG